MQRYNGQLINQFANVINGNAAAGALVTVKLKSTGATVTLYAEDNLSGATLANPLTTDAKGYYGFYAPDGVYTLDVSISGTPQLEIQLQDVAALQAQFDAALANAGYIPVGTFAAGCTVSQSNGVVSDGSSFWRWDGALPKTVTAGSAPTPTGAGNWILISDYALRSELAATDSTTLVGGKEAASVGYGGDTYSRYKTTVNFSLPDEDADGLRSAMANANKTNQTTYGRFKYINGTASTTGVFDVANFAGQTLGSSASIGFVFHHYTDGAMIQVDNVGEANNIITLKNAHNPTRRSDKAADFVGSGTYIRFDKHNYSLGYSQTLGFVDKDFKIVWTGVAGIATFWQNRADDGTAAFRLQTTNAHVNILDVLNGVANQRSFSIRDDVSFTRTMLRTETNRANGIGLEALDGDVWLLSSGDTTKRVKINKPIQATSGNTQLTASSASVETLVPFLLRGYNTASLPSASTYSGAMIRILDRANKPAYSDGANWLFVSNDTIVS